MFSHSIAWIKGFGLLTLTLFPLWIPFSSANPDFQALFSKKRRVIVFNKSELADPESNKKYSFPLTLEFFWISFFMFQNPNSFLWYIERLRYLFSFVFCRLLFELDYNSFMLKRKRKIQIRPRRFSLHWRMFTQLHILKYNESSTFAFKPFSNIHQLNQFQQINLHLKRTKTIKRRKQMRKMLTTMRMWLSLINQKQRVKLS
jgi:ribosome biogenesis GTPase A